MLKNATSLELAWAAYDLIPEASATLKLAALRVAAREAMEQRLGEEAAALSATPTIKGYAFLLRSWRGIGLSWPEAIHRSGVDAEVGEALRHNQHAKAQRLLDARLHPRE